MALAPLSSSTCFLSAQLQSSVEYSACVHIATLLQSAMFLTTGQLTPPFTCGCVNVVPHTSWCVFCSCRHNFNEKTGEKDYDTWCSQVVSNPSTNQARRGLTSLIRREVVLSSWYGRNSFFSLLSSLNKKGMVCVTSRLLMILSFLLTHNYFLGSFFVFQCTNGQSAINTNPQERRMNSLTLEL